MTTQMPTYRQALPCAIFAVFAFGVGFAACLLIYNKTILDYTDDKSNISIVAPNEAVEMDPVNVSIRIRRSSVGHLVLAASSIDDFMSQNPKAMAIDVSIGMLSNGKGAQIFVKRWPAQPGGQTKYIVDPAGNIVEKIPGR